MAVRDDEERRAAQQQTSPAQVLELLRAGNERFASGEPLMQDRLRQVYATSAGQYPLAVVLACMDSRVATEVIFDLELGDIFSVRVAGNVAGEQQLGSLEFGCAVAGAKLLLVLGHTGCGAINAAVDFASRGVDAVEATGCKHLPTITDDIAALIRDNEAALLGSAGRDEFVDRITARNVRHTMGRIRERSSILDEQIESGRVMLAGGVYDVKTGRVELLDEQQR